MANIMKMMQQAGKMKAKMQEMTERIRGTVFEGEALSGAVKCAISGDYDVKFVSIDPSIVNANDVEVLEDAVLISVNDAINKIRKTTAAETSEMMSDLGLPPGMELPF